MRCSHDLDKTVCKRCRLELKREKESIEAIIKSFELHGNAVGLYTKGHC